MTRSLWFFTRLLLQSWKHTIVAKCTQIPKDMDPNCLIRETNC